MAASSDAPGSATAPHSPAPKPAAPHPSTPSSSTARSATPRSSAPGPVGASGERRPLRLRASALLGRALPALGLFAAVRVLGLVVLAVWAGAEGRSPHQLLSARWDSLWYTDIAAHGYHWPGYQATAHTRGAGAHSHLAFFPLLPWLERGLNTVTGLSYADAGLLVSALASLVAALGIYAVGERVSGGGASRGALGGALGGTVHGVLHGPQGQSRRTATLLVVLWAALPIGVLQSMAYTESLFTALAAWCLFAVLRRSWLTAGLLAAFAGITRPSAAAVIGAVWVGAALAVWHREPGRVRAVLGAVLAPAGLLAYAGWVGGLSSYLAVQADWGNGFDFGAAYARFVGHQLAQNPGAGIGLLAFVGLVLWALVACVRQRQPWPVLAYAAAIVALALGAQAYFNSKPRLLLPGFPLLLPLAAWLATLRPRRVAATLTLVALASSAYGAIWLLGPGPP